MTNEIAYVRRPSSSCCVLVVAFQVVTQEHLFRRQGSSYLSHINELLYIVRGRRHLTLELFSNVSDR
jgi:hypothetical protein